MMYAWQKPELSVRLDVVVRVLGVVVDVKAWLIRTSVIGRLIGSDVVHSGPTHAEEVG